MSRKRKRPQSLGLRSAKRNRRSPEILDRALEGRAGSLQDTVLSLLHDPPPSSPLECRCGGAICLGCCGLYHLLNEGDPQNYRDLLSEAYCVVPPSAPSPPQVFHRVGWSQRQIVMNVMELLCSNVLCIGYDKHTRCSSVGEALCSHAWELLLERIGDNMMVFLLRFSSIFLPLTSKSYQQVTGTLLSKTIQGSKVFMLPPNYTQLTNMAAPHESVKGHHNRKQEKSFPNSAIEPGSDGPGSTSINCSQRMTRKLKRSFSWQRRRQYKHPKQVGSISSDINKKNHDGRDDDFADNEPVKDTCSGLLEFYNYLVKQYIKEDDGSEVIGKAPLVYKNRFADVKQTSNNMFPGSFQSSDISSERKILNVKSSTGYNAQFDYTECYATHHHVVSFIWAVIRCIVPVDMLGDSSSWRAMMSNIAKFVGLRRFEKFYLNQCLRGLETSQYPFLSQVKISNTFSYELMDKSGNTGSYKFQKTGSNKSSGVNVTLQYQILGRWIYWLFSSLVLPIISSCFYVTERQFQKLQVFYYPKREWQKLQDNAVSYLKKQGYKELDLKSVLSVISHRKFGFSKARFLPKKNEVRILANTKAANKIELGTPSKSLCLKSVYSSLTDLHAVLRRIKFEHPETLGSSIFGYDDVYQKLFQFLPKVRSGSSLMTPIYIVAGDVAKAYDSIDQYKLVAILKDIIQEDEYHLRSYIKVLSAKQGMKTLQDHVAYDHNSNNKDIIKFEAGTRLRSSSCVIIDQGKSKCIQKEELHHLLSEHLNRNILKIGRMFYLQQVGICQGSSISPLLCSFYLAHLERSVILPYLEEAFKLQNAINSTSEGCVAESSSYPFTSSGSSLILNCEQDETCLDMQNWSQNNNLVRGCSDESRQKSLSSSNNLLLRWTDDFLFISTSKHLATSFFRRMQRGFKEYNCDMNIKKFCLSFDMGENRHVQNRLYIGEDGVQFLPWSGLLINCHTLEIQADYTRYLGIPIRETISVQENGYVLSILQAKLCDYMRPKCHPLFYDANINSSRIVGLNAYQAFLLGAMKFHCYVSIISDYAKLTERSLLGAIEHSFRFMYMLIKKQMHKVGTYFSIAPILELTEVDMVWLGLSAYIWVLKRKQTRQKELLRLLRLKISTYGRREDFSDALKYATDVSHSSIFQDISFY